MGLPKGGYRQDDPTTPLVTEGQVEVLSESVCIREELEVYPEGAPLQFGGRRQPMESLYVPREYGDAFTEGHRDELGALLTVNGDDHGQ